MDRGVCIFFFFFFLKSYISTPPPQVFCWQNHTSRRETKAVSIAQAESQRIQFWKAVTPLSVLEGREAFVRHNLTKIEGGKFHPAEPHRFPKKGGGTIYSGKIIPRLEVVSWKSVPQPLAIRALRQAILEGVPLELLFVSPL